MTEAPVLILLWNRLDGLSFSGYSSEGNHDVVWMGATAGTGCLYSHSDPQQYPSYNLIFWRMIYGTGDRCLLLLFCHGGLR